jgi:hypothetical protein
MTINAKFRFSISYLFDAPELEKPPLPFLLLVFSKVRLKKV